MGFNLNTYRELLVNAQKAGYNFCDFSVITGNKIPILSKSNICLLRHDVDADVSAALVMAKLEQQLEVASTYFVMLRSPLYNLLGRKNHCMVEEIINLGHSIGLHYDQGFDSIRNWSLTQTAAAIEEEAQVLEAQFNTKVTAVSFHQPGSAVLQGNIDTGFRVNTYDRQRLAEFEYHSDSNRQFKLAEFAKGNIADSVASLRPNNLQLLIHPIWWVYDDPTTEAVWDKAINSNLQKMQEQLIETERAYGLPRQFDIYFKQQP